MTWLVYSLPRSGRTGIELDALMGPLAEIATIVSRHESYSDAGEALAAYRRRQEREAAEAAGQKDLFSEVP